MVSYANVEVLIGVFYIFIDVLHLIAPLTTLPGFLRRTLLKL